MRHNYFSFHSSPVFWQFARCSLRPCSRWQWFVCVASLNNFFKRTRSKLFPNSFLYVVYTKNPSKNSRYLLNSCWTAVADSVGPSTIFFPRWFGPALPAIPWSSMTRRLDQQLLDFVLVLHMEINYARNYSSCFKTHHPRLLSRLQNRSLL